MIGLLVVDFEMQEGNPPRDTCMQEEKSVFTEEIKTDCSLLRYKSPCPGASRPSLSLSSLMQSLIHLLKFLLSQRPFFSFFLPLFSPERNARVREKREKDRNGRMRESAPRVRLPDSQFSQSSLALGIGLYSPTDFYE